MKKKSHINFFSNHSRPYKEYKNVSLINGNSCLVVKVATSTTPTPVARLTPIVVEGAQQPIRIHASTFPPFTYSLLVSGLGPVSSGEVFSAE